MSLESLNLPTESCKQSLINIIEQDFQIKNYKYEINAGSSIGDNYIGIIYRIKIKDTDNEENVKSIILKLPPLNQARREQFEVRKFFVREAKMYLEYLPLLMKFQESKGIIPIESGFYEVPKCYSATITDMEEAIFMEDLKQSGYEMFNRFDDVTYEHAKVSVQVLGKLHALSFAIKDQDFEKFKQYTELHDVMTERDDNSFDLFMSQMMNRALETLDNDESDKYYKERLEKLFEKKFLDILRDCVDSKAAEPYAIITHGDSWNNNILYKNKVLEFKLIIQNFKSHKNKFLFQNNIPVGAMLLDWQMSRYTSPVLDMIYYIFGCTTKDFRDLYYNDILNDYYNSLSSFLKT